MRVAHLRTEGKDAINKAWFRIISWAKKNGLSDQDKSLRSFSFNTLEAPIGSEEFWYEVMIAIGEHDVVEEEGWRFDMDLKLKLFMPIV